VLPSSRLRVPPIDAIVAGALFLAAQVEVWAPRFMIGTDTAEGSHPILALTAGVGTLALAWRRAAPLPSAIVVFAAYGIQGLVTTPTQGLTGLTALVLAAYSVARHASTASAMAGAAVALLAITALSTDLADWTFAFALVAAAWAIGLGTRKREASAEFQREDAVRTERGRIARELHDIVSHRVTTMVIQAQAAETQLETKPDTAAASLSAIQENGRQALGELRVLLGLLRADGEAEGRAPQPGIADLEALVEETRSTGLPVELRVSGEVYDISPGVSLAAYRVVQEALTNALKHGGHAATEVAVAYRPAELCVTVSDRGPGSRNGHQPGHGLLGMRERVAVHGGTLETSSAEATGFKVVATFPRGAQH